MALRALYITWATALAFGFGYLMNVVILQDRIGYTDPVAWGLAAAVPLIVFVALVFRFDER